MRTAITPAAGALLVLLFALPVQSQNIKGDWQLKSCKINGEDVPADQLAEMKLSMTYATFEAVAGDRKSSGKIDNENRSQPARLTFTIEDGEDAGRVLKAIYKQVGKNLEIAFSRSGEFPTNFESDSSNQYAVMTYKPLVAKVTRASAGEIRRRKRAPVTLMSSGTGQSQNQNQSQDDK